eukprot:NODE_1128_length_2109_cov_23.678248_g942_i1.p1 GENE.NODE_1128_length_2109_cov_23.678248_g942_i1~~NODE_1128_length_2109_cov_23.678248_g942_i1.p1  ORF type:complete len:390 (-),score=82.33 NODE_1128_length_2109_cov_23.678248_g942_i1:76-1245(-)
MIRPKQELFYVKYTTYAFMIIIHKLEIILMSHIPDMVVSFSPQFQILFNRVLAQLGMAAFRLGQFKDVHIALNELCSSQRVRELLAQGSPPMVKSQERTPEQEKLEKAKLIPFHMHINLDLLEAMHLVSAMLTEVPMIAANPHEAKRKIQSKAFNKLLNFYDAQVFLGPPENTRDHVYAGMRALLTGDWKKCTALIVDLPVWELSTGNDRIRTTLTQRIKEESLRSYLLQYAQFYDTISQKLLAEKFELPDNTVHSVVSKMMFNEELQGSWDQPAACVRVYRNAPSKLQFLCTQMAEKAQSLVEYNERILEARAGGFKMGQEMKPNRPSESLWGNLNRWALIGGSNQSGWLRRQPTQRNSAFPGMQGNRNNRQTRAPQYGMMQQRPRNY